MISTQQTGDHRSSYEVGHGKPPHASRFKPGQSGNPRGRPPGKPNKLRKQTQQRTLDAILAEANRKIPFKVNGRSKKITVKEGVMRSISYQALSGNTRAQRHLIQIIRQAEAEESQRVLENFKVLLDHKASATAEIYERQKQGRSIDDIIPHPDQIEYDLRAGTAWITGPLCADEKPEWDRLRQVHALHSGARDQALVELKTEQDSATLKCIRADLALSNKILAKTSLLFGDR